MVVEKCSFCDVFLKVVFKKHVNYNEKSLFVISERKKKNELIASELNSFEKVRMRIYIQVARMPRLIQQQQSSYALQ